MSFNALFSVLLNNIHSDRVFLCSLLWWLLVWCYVIGRSFRQKGLTGSSGEKVSPKRSLLQYFLLMLKVCIGYVWKYHAAFSLGTQTEAQLIQKLSNMHFLIGKSMEQNHCPHYLIHFISRAVHLKHLLGSMGKYFNSFFRWNRLERPLCKRILRQISEWELLWIWNWASDIKNHALASFWGKRVNLFWTDRPSAKRSLKGEGKKKKNPERHFLYSQKTECHGENDEGMCV